MIKRTKRHFDQTSIQELENCTANKSDFWKKYKNITRKKNQSELPDPNSLQIFFEELYSDTNNAENAIPFENSKNINEKIKDEISNTKISLEEIKKQIQNLKNNKATERIP